MTRKDQKMRKEHQVAALEKLFGKHSQAEVVRKTKIPKSTLSRALDRTNPGLMSDDTRLQLARSLGSQCQSDDELRTWVERAGWEMGREEWREAFKADDGIARGYQLWVLFRVQVLESTRKQCAYQSRVVGFGPLAKALYDSLGESVCNLPKKFIVCLSDQD